MKVVSFRGQRQVPNSVLRVKQGELFIMPNKLFINGLSEETPLEEVQAAFRKFGKCRVLARVRIRIHFRGDIMESMVVIG